MTIHYTNGHTVEGILLSRTEGAMRVSIPGFDDAAEFQEINGTWVSEDCGPVRVEFTRTRNANQSTVTADDCICQKDLAARLIQMLLAGEGGGKGTTAKTGAASVLDPAA